MKNNRLPENPNKKIKYNHDKLQKIYLAGGCFWGVEAYFQRIYGVADTDVGYANGLTENPSYQDVCYKNTGHAETVEISYDPNKINLSKLLDYFFRIIDPTLLNRQGNDIGAQYRTGIYYLNESDLPMIKKVIETEQKKFTKKIVTEVLPLTNYYSAEPYHQDYLDKNPSGYCHVDFNKLGDQNLIRVDPEKFSKPDDQELLKKLTPAQYEVTQKNATEPAFKNEFFNNDAKGIYVDVTTGEPLFTSSDKFDSGCGWPSFAKPIDSQVINYIRDNSFGMERTEVRSRVGNAHLGHVFNDGPEDLGGLRYCINSLSLRFIPYKEMDVEGYGEYKELCDD